MSQSISFDPVADRYDATRYHHAEVSERIAAGLMAVGRIPAGGSMLEIGIGTGRIALPLLAAGINVTGVDISTRMVERLWAKYDERRAAAPERTWGTLTVEMADMTALPFADGAFDAVVGVHVLHLAPEWRRALAEALRVTKRGGAVLIGQDVREDEARSRIHEEWDAIVEDLGYNPDPVGAASFQSIVDELRSRGVPVEIRTLATWQEENAPREALLNITERLWSRTWAVPDDLFAESSRRLTAWAEREYGDTLDTPHVAAYSFRVAVGRVGA
ncbi:MAG: hypothetical protein OJF49_002682 [Ktedonobacterales bacterium]|jgi:ubiquinone/menaquinone biosynthesis C-methylase UbiE|nr:MAG: hypothetical protein OJF49_002682 [Ktedonobacterales bacterium]